MIGNISIIGFIVAVTVSIGCMITGLWMLFSRKYKHDPRNPIGTAIAMLLMPLGLGLLAFNEIGFFPALLPHFDCYWNWIWWRRR